MDVPVLRNAITASVWNSVSRFHGMVASPRRKVHVFTFVRDSSIVALAYVLTLFVTFEVAVSRASIVGLTNILPPLCVVSCVCLCAHRLHRRTRVYARMCDVRPLLEVAGLTLLTAVIFEAASYWQHPFPVSVVIVGVGFSALGLLVVQSFQETTTHYRVLPTPAETVSRLSPSLHSAIDLDEVFDPYHSGDRPIVSIAQTLVRDRVVLVTGAAGSIGSELMRQLVLLQPERVIALDSNETALFHLVNEVSELAGVSPVESELASVQVSEEMYGIFERYQPDVVFHAAAYKHVPILEGHPDQGVVVNIGGTLNVCKAARHYGCKRLVFVSTDKAVQPTNVLGYTKRIGELLTRAYQDSCGSAFCSVRFGNVIGSQGSVLPEFLRQISVGGPVTVTDPHVERYFMTIGAAVDLLIQAGGSAEAGDLFMLDMGEPVNIADAARRLIRMNGLRVGTDIEIEYTGLRPGDKLSESLVFPTEVVIPTDNPRILRIEDRSRFDQNELKAEVCDLLDHVYDYSQEDLKGRLRRLTLLFGGGVEGVAVEAR